MLEITLLLAQVALLVTALFHLGSRARRTGWAALADRYPAGPPLGGRTWNGQAASLNTANYTGIRMTASPDGLRMEWPSIWNRGHKPILVPWSEISRTSQEALFGHVAVLAFKGQPDAILKISQKLANEMWANQPASDAAADELWEEALDAPSLHVRSNPVALRKTMTVFTLLFGSGMLLALLQTSNPARPTPFSMMPMVIGGVFASVVVAALTFRRVLPTLMAAIPKLWYETSWGTAIAAFLWWTTLALPVCLAVPAANTQFDTGQPTRQTLEVLDTESGYTKNGRWYRLITSSWRGNSSESMNVDERLFQLMHAGDKVTVPVYPGALGCPWFKRNEIEAERRAQTR